MQKPSSTDHFSLAGAVFMVEQAMAVIHRHREDPNFIPEAEDMEHFGTLQEMFRQNFINLIWMMRDMSERSKRTMIARPRERD